MEAKNRIGGRVLKGFEGRVVDSLFTEDHFARQIDEASRLAEDMPYVTLAFRNKGIIKPDEGTAKIIHVFRPNLWAQDVAHTVGKLGKMTVETAKERADSSIEYLYNTSAGLHKTLKESGKTFHDFSDAYRESALIEAAYYTILSGKELSKDVDRRIKTAMMKRLISNEYDFKKIVETCGVDFSDNLALFQFSNEMDIKEIFQDIVSHDPYFNRRQTQIDSFVEINSTKSIGTPQTMTEKFAYGVLERLSRKYPAMARQVFNQ